jgi:hypothetical protein
MFNESGGTQWCSWLRHCATSRKVACSIPDEVTGIFQWLNPSGRIVALGSTQPPTKMSTRNPSWELRRPVRRADNLATFMSRFSRNSGASASRNPKGPSRPVAGNLYLFYLNESAENIFLGSSTCVTYNNRVVHCMTKLMLWSPDRIFKFQGTL